MKKQPKLTPNQCELVINLYKSGVGTSRICVEQRLPSAQVEKLIRDSGLTRERRHSQSIASKQKRWDNVDNPLLLTQSILGGRRYDKDFR